MADDLDAQLLARLRSNDETALAELFERHFASLTVFLTRIVGASDIAADLAGDVFIRLWERRHELTVRSTLAAYIYTTARNLALNYTRDEQGRARLLATYGTVEHEVPAMAEMPQSVEETLDRDERAAQIRQVIHALPVAQRQAVLLRWCESLPYPDVALAMGISVNAAKLHVSRALKVLRRYFGEHFSD